MNWGIVAVLIVVSVVYFGIVWLMDQKDEEIDDYKGELDHYGE